MPTQELTYIPLNDHEKYFYTYDLSLVASLVSRGHELVSLDKENPRKVNFIFKKSRELERDETEYWNGQLLVEPRSFFDDLKMLKQRIYSA